MFTKATFLERVLWATHTLSHIPPTSCLALEDGSLVACKALVIIQCKGEDINKLVKLRTGTMSMTQRHKKTAVLHQQVGRKMQKGKKECRTYWRYRESNTGWRGSGSEH